MKYNLAVSYSIKIMKKLNLLLVALTTFSLTTVTKASRTDSSGLFANIITVYTGITTLSIKASKTTRNKEDAVKLATLQFIHSSYAVIEFEIANGEGKYLNTLLTLLEVSEDNANKFKSELRTGFTNIVSNIEYSDQTTLEQTKALFNLAQTIRSNIS